METNRSAPGQRALEVFLRTLSTSVPHSSYKSMRLICQTSGLIDKSTLSEISDCFELFAELYRRKVFTPMNFSCLKMLLLSERLYSLAKQLVEYEQYTKASLLASLDPEQPRNPTRSQGESSDGLRQPGSEGRQAHHSATHYQSGRQQSARAPTSSSTGVIAQETGRQPIQASHNFAADSPHGNQDAALRTPLDLQYQLGFSDLPDYGTGAARKDTPRVSVLDEFCKLCHSPNMSRSTVQQHGYSLRHGKGLVLIINIERFDPSTASVHLTDRRGSAEDVRRLQQCFGEFLNCPVEVQRNFPKEQLLEYLRRVAERDHTDTDCLFCFLMSHGCEESLFMHDGELVELKTIVQIFKDGGKLDHIPKLFFTQACRNSVSDNPELLALMERATKELSGSQAANSTPIDGDILIGFPTLANGTALREEHSGSLYIESLCQCITQLVPRHESLLNILLEVNRKVADKANDYQHNQDPMQSHSLKRLLQLPCPRCRECCHQ
ncbi:caspase-8-like [Sycon ciliatum]|uniref:caspase-8-like n=1 Tax=Sycon ciliatum TaxID=27933 RepID=UPI0031F643B7